MATMSTAKKDQALKLLSAKHIMSILPRLVQVNCYGCRTNHPNLFQHDVCWLMTKEKQIDSLLDLAIAKLQIKNVCDEFLEKHPEEDESATDVFFSPDFEEWRNEVKFILNHLV